MIDMALLRAHSRPMVALGLDLRSQRMDLARYSSPSSQTQLLLDEQDANTKLR